MAYINVQSDGNAPKSSQIGDTVHTAGGDYTIVSPNSAGATYNPNSGFWSVKNDSNLVSNSGFDEATKTGQTQTNNNNALMDQAAQLANSISAFSSAKQYQFNREEAQKTRDWQEYMSNTAHQREVRDLLLAGLNPVLSAQNGGASTPSGATASGSAYQGQKSDVDTSLLPYMSNLIGAFLGYNSQMNIAQIQQETALQTAKISSAASMYNADKASAASMFSALEAASASRYGSDKSFESSNWINKIAGDAYDYFKDSFGSGSDSSAKGQSSKHGSYYSPIELIKFISHKFQNKDSKDTYSEWYSE